MIEFYGVSTPWRPYWIRSTFKWDVFCDRVSLGTNEHSHANEHEAEQKRGQHGDDHGHILREVVYLQSVAIILQNNDDRRRGGEEIVCRIGP